MAGTGDDFDPKQAFTKLSANLEQPDKFAETFCTAAKTQKNIDNVLKENIKILIQHDNETRNFIKVMIKEVEQEDVVFWWKKIGTWGFGLISFVVGIILEALTHSIIGHFLEKP